MKEVYVGAYGHGVWARKGRSKMAHLWNADGVPWALAGKSLCGRVCAQRVFPEREDTPRCKLCMTKQKKAVAKAAESGR